MQQRTVGTSGLKVSRLGLGTLTWGRDVDADTAVALLRAFTDVGGTLVDTAPAYGQGAAEQMVGRFLRRGHPRNDVVIMTKAGFGVTEGQSWVDTSRAGLLADLEGSLQRLGTDHVDVWQLHAWGDAPLEESLAAMDYAVSAGMARYAGVANFVGWQTAEAVTWQRAGAGRTPIVSTQVEYSLLARRAEVEVLPAVRHYGIGFFPWSPLGRGVLSGRYRSGIPRDSRGASTHLAWFVEPYLEQRSRSVVEAVAKAADGLDMEPEQVALCWVRDAPAVTAPLLGARTVAQLEQLLLTETLSLPYQIADALDDVSGGPNAGRPQRVDA